MTLRTERAAGPGLWIGLLIWMIGLGGPARAQPARPAPLTVLDLTAEPDVAAGDAMAAWLRKRAGWEVKFGTPLYFYIQGGSLHLLARPGPAAGSILPWKLAKREDKVLLRVTPEGFRLRPAERPQLEVTLAPVRLPGRGADVTDSERNDACFYLLVAFDGPKKSFRGQRVADTVAYVWADGAWRGGGPVGRERKYGAFMRYLALGRGAEGLGQPRTVVRDVAADFRLAYPERAGAGGAAPGAPDVPDVIEVGLMVDSNTVKSEAESLVRSVRFR